MASNPERRQSISAAAEKQVREANEASQAMMRLWQSRVDMALAMDDDEVLRAVVEGPGGEASLWDRNTNCSGCGGTGPAHWA